MLVNGLKFIGMPVMSIQTGRKLAETSRALIDPNNLKIVGYEVNGSLLAERPSFLRMNDVREISPLGMIIDSNDEFVGLDDVIAIKKVYELDFDLIGKLVVDNKKRHIGKVVNYNINITSLLVQQLRVRPTLLKSLNTSELLIDRSQIIEINNKRIIVKAPTVKETVAEKITASAKPDFINPFRKPQTQIKAERQD